MSKDKYEKIPISEFVKQKVLNRIHSVIDKNETLENAYDIIEALLEDDYQVKNAGTNRLILISKKKKYEDLIFKVAGDSHGIDANRREFFNGDLDKRLTYSYSISDDGIFLVQERVRPMTEKEAHDNKKELRKMLSKLSEKILLVDCKLSNFKNFGFRKNGEVCLLDHGDTVPLGKYQDMVNSVNYAEESGVSLRCKQYKDSARGKLKACDGKLHYTKNYDMLECEKCHALISVNDAYRDIYAASNDEDKPYKVDIDVEQIRKDVAAYCLKTMSPLNSIKETEESVMGSNRNCNSTELIELAGYEVPKTLNSPMYRMDILNVKSSKMKIEDFLKKYELDPSECKVSKNYTGNKVNNSVPTPKPIPKSSAPKLPNVSRASVDVTDGSEKYKAAISNVKSLSDPRLLIQVGFVTYTEFTRLTGIKINDYKKALDICKCFKALYPEVYVKYDMKSSKFTFTRYLSNAERSSLEKDKKVIMNNPETIKEIKESIAIVETAEDDKDAVPYNGIKNCVPSNYDLDIFDFEYLKKNFDFTKLEAYFADNIRNSICYIIDIYYAIKKFSETLGTNKNMFDKVLYHNDGMNFADVSRFIYFAENVFVNKYLFGEQNIASGYIVVDIDKNSLLSVAKLIKDNISEYNPKNDAIAYCKSILIPKSEEELEDEENEEDEMNEEINISTAEEEDEEIPQRPYDPETDGPEEEEDEDESEEDDDDEEDSFGKALDRAIAEADEDDDDEEEEENYDEEDEDDEPSDDDYEDEDDNVETTRRYQNSKIIPLRSAVHLNQLKDNIKMLSILANAAGVYLSTEDEDGNETLVIDYEDFKNLNIKVNINGSIQGLSLDKVKAKFETIMNSEEISKNADTND